MTTVLETNTNPSVPTTVSAMQDIPLNQIQESKTNPRRRFDETKLAELAENIRLHGVLRQPLAKDSNLAQAASRYKIDAEQLTVEVRTELSKKKEKSEAESTPARKEKPAKRQ